MGHRHKVGLKVIIGLSMFQAGVVVRPMLFQFGATSLPRLQNQSDIPYWVIWRGATVTATASLHILISSSTWRNNACVQPASIRLSWQTILIKSDLGGLLVLHVYCIRCMSQLGRQVNSTCRSVWSWRSITTFTLNLACLYLNWKLSHYVSWPYRSAIEI